MDRRYAGQKLITLTEAKKNFGYTSDHLAFLCRSGFLWAERHGRTWLTCAKAVEDYRQVLVLAGKPFKTEKHFLFLDIPKPGMEKDARPRTTASEKDAAKGSVVSCRVANLRVGEKTSGRSVSLKHKYTQLFYYFADVLTLRPMGFSGAVKAGLAVADSPTRLPVCGRPRCLRLSPVVFGQLIAAPLAALFLFSAVAAAPSAAMEKLTFVQNGVLTGLDFITRPMQEMTAYDLRLAAVLAGGGLTETAAGSVANNNHGEQATVAGVLSSQDSSDNFHGSSGQGKSDADGRIIFVIMAGAEKNALPPGIEKFCFLLDKVGDYLEKIGAERPQAVYYDDGGVRAIFRVDNSSCLKPP